MKKKNYKKSRKNTKSVVKYLNSEDGTVFVYAYFSRIAFNDIENVKVPNYSNFIAEMKLEKATTKDDIVFDSPTIERGYITDYLYELFMRYIKALYN